MSNECGNMNVDFISIPPESFKFLFINPQRRRVSQSTGKDVKLGRSNITSDPCTVSSYGFSHDKS